MVVGEGFIPPGMFAAAEGFRGVGDAAPYVGWPPVDGWLREVAAGCGHPALRMQFT